jgi:hypothetical protein
MRPPGGGSIFPRPTLMKRSDSTFTGPRPRSFPRENRIDAEKEEDVEDGQMRKPLKLSRLLNLKVPRKSPRKHLSVQADDKIRVTVMIAPT